MIDPTSIAEETRPDRVAPADATAPRVATIDVGTNSIRLLVAEVLPDGRYRLLDDEKVTERLGRGMTSSKRFTDETMASAARTIARLRTIALGQGVDIIRAVATCAVREAKNRSEFLRIVRDEAKIDLEIISGEEEARLAFESVASAFDIRNDQVATVDIGGGSTEIVLSADGVIEQIASLPLGGVRLTERVAAQPTAERRLRRLRHRIQRALDRHFPSPAFEPDYIVGTGGTFTSLAQLDGQGNVLRGHEFTLADVRRWLDRLSVRGQEGRVAMGLTPERAEIIVAGVAIAEGVMRALKCERMLVHDRGIRDGLLLGITRGLFPEHAAPASHDRMEAVRAFARRCRYAEPHSEHVTRLALSLHDQLLTVLPTLPEGFDDPAGRSLLEAGGVLHDIGYLINHARHHKHAYHLIMHSGLETMGHRELAIVANIARYHRRALPRDGHANFKRLSEPDKDLVRAMAAVLRIADGFDRAHALTVQDLDVSLEGETLVIHAISEREPEVELWGAERKSDLLADVLERRVRLAWRPAGASSS